jgi:lysophospholipase L1-like esterase
LPWRRGYTYRMRPTTVLLILLSVLLILALIAAYQFYRNWRMYERITNELRLDPLLLRAYPREDATFQPEVLRVVFFGDSRAASWPAPEGLTGFEFINRGIPAETSLQAGGRFQAHVAPLQPDVVVIQVGVNDLFRISYFPERYDEVVARCLLSIKRIVELSHVAGAHVVLVTIFPTAQADALRTLNRDAAELREVIRAVNAELMQLEGEGLTILDSAPLLSDEVGVVRPEYAEDELHLNREGYAVLNLALVEILRGLAAGR